MAIPLPKYAKIKDNYCVGYFGHDPAVLHSLLLMKPYVEKELPGLKLFVAFHDKFKMVAQTTAQATGDESLMSRVVLGSELEKRINDYEFAYYRELDPDNDNCVYDWLKESEIPYPTVPWPGENLKAPA